MALTQVQGSMLNGSTSSTTTIQSNGTNAIYIDSSQSVGIGVSNPSSGYTGKLTVATTNVNSSFATDGSLRLVSNANVSSAQQYSKIQWINENQNGVMSQISCYRETSPGAPGALAFYTSPNVDTYGYTPFERMRIDSAGVVNINTTGLGGIQARFNIQQDASGSYYPFAINNTAAGTTSYVIQDFYRNGSRTGTITQTGGTSYNTTSDYRLKKDVQPMVNALERVALLKPVTFKWKEDDSVGEGFIAHELQEVCPLAVHGEKDAVDKNGNIDSQGVDTSHLVGLLTAAIQELNAKVTALEAQLQAK